MLPELPKGMSEEERAKYIASFDSSAVNRTIQVDDEVYQYLLNCSVREHPLLKELRAETSLYYMARMQVSPETGQLLSILIKLMNAKNILEIGVFTGYSALSMGMAMADDARLFAIEKKQMWLDIANRYIKKAGLDEKVNTRLGDALPVLKELMAEKQVFDFIFIDADKSNQIAYYQSAKQLLRSGGCIAIDNTLWWGNVAKEQFNDKDTVLVRKLNQYIYDDEEVDISMITIGDGLTLIHKK